MQQVIKFNSINFKKSYIKLNVNYLKDAAIMENPFENDLILKQGEYHFNIKVQCNDNCIESIKKSIKICIRESSQDQFVEYIINSSKFLRKNNTLETSIKVLYKKNFFRLAMKIDTDVENLNVEITSNYLGNIS